MNAGPINETLTERRLESKSKGVLVEVLIKVLIARW